jgi:hypothetical protein
MAIEIGLLFLINASISSPPFAGGAISELPKNASYPNYTLRWISEPQNLGQTTKSNLRYARVEIRCFGDPEGSGSDAIDLATAISADAPAGISGFSGVLADSDATRVSSIFKSNQMDLSIDPGTRAYRRMIEFEVNYW